MNDINLINPELPAPPAAKRVWGGWATAGFGAVVLVVFVIVQVVVMVIALLVIALTHFGQFSNLPYQDIMNSIMDILTGNLGLLQSFATIGSGIIGIGLIIILVKVHKHGVIAEYLGLNKISIKTVLLVIAVVIGFLALSSGLNIWLGRTDNEQIMNKIYETSVWPALLWISVIIFAPAFEEALFRGFLFEGLRQSRLGTIGTIGITAAVWALMHSVQYSLFNVAWIFILGIVMGIIRFKTKSLWSTFIMHAFYNAVGMLLIALNIGG